MSDVEPLCSSRRSRVALALAGLAVLAASGFGVYLATSDKGMPLGVDPQTIAQPASQPQPVPALHFQGADGKRLALSDLRGKVVLLNVWATWCVPCRQEMLALDRLQQKLGGSAFEVVALSIDRGGAADVRRFYDEIGIRALAIYVDASMEATGRLKTVGVPTTLLIDREGRELWRKTGPAEWDAPKTVDSLRRHISAAPSLSN